MYVTFLNMCGIDCVEVPKGAWKILRHINYKDLIVGIVVEEKKTMTIGQICIKYDISMSQCKYYLYGRKS